MTGLVLVAVFLAATENPQTVPAEAKIVPLEDRPTACGGEWAREDATSNAMVVTGTPAAIQVAQEEGVKFFFPIVSYFRTTTPAEKDRVYSRLLESGVVKMVGSGHSVPWMSFTLEDGRMRIVFRYHFSTDEVAEIEKVGALVRSFGPDCSMVVMSNQWTHSHCRAEEGRVSCNFPQGLTSDYFRLLAGVVANPELALAVEVQPR